MNTTLNLSFSRPAGTSILIVKDATIINPQRREQSYVFLIMLVLCLFVSTTIPAAAAIDPGAPGPLQVAVKEYGSYNTLIQLPGSPGPVEVLARVWHPVKMTRAYPLVIFLHGRHLTCHQGIRGEGGFPCAPGYQNIPNYLGYDYVAQSLARHGYIVVSISANGINARDNLVNDRGAFARAQLIQYHLNLWRSFSTRGDPLADPFNGLFFEHVNLV